MPYAYRILLLDDDPEFHEIFKDFIDLATKGEVVLFHAVETPEAAVAALQETDYTAVFVDYRLGEKTGIDFVRDCQVLGIEAAFVLLTGFNSEQAEAEALAIGAFDFLPKGDIQPDMLSRCIRHAHAILGLRKGMLAALRQAQAASSAKTNFLGHMSHELRTPLNGVLGFAEMLCMNPENDTETIATYAEYIRQSGGKLLELIDGLLTLSATRFDNDMPEEIVSVNKFFADTCDRYATIAQARRIGFALQALSEDRYILTNREALELAVSPIIDNAVKFTESGGKVVVDVALTDSLVVTVTDTGAGMDATTLERAKSPFYQHDSHLARTRGGAGIGLAISRNSVDALGGATEIESEHGVGTSVCISLPARLETGAEVLPAKLA